MKIQGKAAEQIEKLLEEFKSGNVPETVAKIVLSGGDCPSAKWSMLNRWLAYVQTGDTDCRGFKQWQSAGRNVKKGEHAAWILRPIIVKKTKKDDNEENVDNYVLIGYGSIPVFGLHQTEGDPINNNFIPEEPPALYDIALKLGVKVDYSAFMGKFYGQYSSGKNEILLCTHDEQTFLHELSHSAHDRVVSGLKGGQHPDQEIVAEFCSCVLARIYGKKSPNEGNTYNYIDSYSRQIKKTPAEAILSFMADIVKVLDFIIDQKEEISIAA